MEGPALPSQVSALCTPRGEHCCVIHPEGCPPPAALLQCCGLQGCKLHPARLHRTPCTAASCTAASLVADFFTAAPCTAASCTLHNCILHGCIPRGYILHDCILDGCILHSCILHGCISHLAWLHAAPRAPSAHGFAVPSPLSGFAPPPFQAALQSSDAINSHNKGLWKNIPSLKAEEERCISRGAACSSEASSAIGGTEQCPVTWHSHAAESRAALMAQSTPHQGCHCQG